MSISFNKDAHTQRRCVRWDLTVKTLRNDTPCCSELWFLKVPLTTEVCPHWTKHYFMTLKYLHFFLLSFVSREWAQWWEGKLCKNVISETITSWIAVETCFKPGVQLFLSVVLTSAVRGVCRRAYTCLLGGHCGALLAALRVMYGSGAPRCWQAYLGY